MPLQNLNRQFESPGEIKTFLKMLGRMAVMAAAGEHLLKGFMEYSLHSYLQEHSSWIVQEAQNQQTYKYV